MTRVVSFAALLLLVFFVSSSLAVGCTNPSAISIQNQPYLDTTVGTGTQIVSNTNTHVDSNDSRLLQLSVKWDAVDNRTVSYVGLGPSFGLCSNYLINNATGQNGWTATTSSCVTTLFAQYTWPEALYGSTCAPQFQTSTAGDNFTVSFSIYIHFEDYVPTLRAGETFFTQQSSSVIVPVILAYPKTVGVSLTGTRVFALASITIDVALTSQTVNTTTTPLNVKFDSFIGRSFAITPTSISYFNGSNSPSALDITPDGADTFVSETGGITRAQHWNMAITPDAGQCEFDGWYLVNVGIYWTGVDEQGNPLSPSANPIPNNTTASFGFKLDSQSFCGVLINNSITATLDAYIDAPTSSGHGSQAVHTGFIEDSTVYFRAAVTSVNLPIESVTLTELKYTPASGAAVTLVSNGVSGVPAISYAAPTLSSSLANETNFQFVANHTIFQLGQDTSLTYVFDATLTVTYQTSNGPGKRNVNVRRQSGGSSSTTKASTSLTIQKADTSSAISSLTIGMFGVVLAAFYSFLLLL